MDMMKKLVAFCLMGTTILVSPAFARIDDSVTKSEGAVLYQGQAAANALVSVTVLDSDVTLEQFMQGGHSAAVVGYKDAVAGSDGKFNITFNFGDASGVYDVYAGEAGQTGIKKENVTYVNETKNSLAVADVKLKLTTPTDLDGILMTKWKDLGVEKELITAAASADFEKAALLLSGEVNVAALTDAKVVSEYIDKALSTVLINNSKIGIIDAVYGNPLASNAGKWYKKAYMDDTAKQYVLSKLDRTTTTMAAFDKEFIEATILGVISASDGYGDVQTILLENAATFGLDTAKITEANARYLQGKTFDAVDNSIFPTTASSGLGGSTGSGGGGGGSLSGTVFQGEGQVVPPVLPKPEKTKLSDMAGFEWATKAVNTLYDRGFISGKQEGVFAPADKVTREEFVKIIFGVSQFENLDGTIEFKDVSIGDWYYDYVKNAFLAGIVKGISGDEFGVGKNITRQDMAVMCYNALVKKGIVRDDNNVEPADFKDFDKVAFYAQEAVNVLSSLGLANGDAGFFYPEANASRAEAAQMLYNVLTFIEK